MEISIWKQENVIVMQYIVVYFADIANVKMMVTVSKIHVSVPKTMVERFVKHASARTVEHVNVKLANVLLIFMEIYAKISCAKMEASMIIWETVNVLICLKEIFVKTANVKMMELVMEKIAHAPIIMKENYAKI
jgi:hypothetical protein